MITSFDRHAAAAAQDGFFVGFLSSWILDPSPATRVARVRASETVLIVKLMPMLSENFPCARLALATSMSYIFQYMEERDQKILKCLSARDYLSLDCWPRSLTGEYWQETLQ
jgi:hypothetical protein